MSYFDEVMADGPVVYLRMDDSSPNDPIDSSGNGNNVTTKTGTPVYQIEGAISADSPNYAIQLDNDPTYLSISDHPTLDLGDTFSIEAWIKRSRNGGALEEAIVVKYDQAYGMFWENDRLAIVRSNVAIICTSTITITDLTTWHHCVVTKSGAACNIYIDTVNVTGTVTNSTCADSANGLHIGHENSASVMFGSIDEVAVYPTVLSQDRVKAHNYAATDLSIQSGMTIPFWG